MAAELLVVAETRASRPTAITREVLGLARTVAREMHGEVAAVTFDSAAAAELIACGADRVYAVDSAAEDCDSELRLANVESLARELKPRVILMPHTSCGADLAPRLATRLDGGAAMGCIGIEVAAGKLLFTRACHGGNVRETLSFSGTAVATVKAGVGTERRDVSRKGEVTRVAPSDVQARFRVTSRHLDTSTGKQLEDAKVVVAGGRGLEGAEGFRVLEKLAHVLDGVVGASRVPCDLGWCPHSWQIGLTGRTVTPDLYFAVGISGAGHHLAGCGNSKTIVAINTDPDAAIFREARFGIVGDYREIVPALAEALQQAKQT